MRYLSSVITLCISLILVLNLCSCVHRSAPLPLELSDKEQDCLNHISKDRYMRILRTDRESDGTLVVRTRQGEIIIIYRIDCISADNADAAVSECIRALDHHLPYQQVEK